jgi:putative hydrolase of HD superfamily
MIREKLAKMLGFSKVVNKLQGVERVVRVPETERRENDVEHSYHLAMLAWYIADSNGLTLNKHLLLSYALIHDFVEVYAGDTYVYSKNKADHDSKKEREENARLRIEKEFPEFRDLHDTISEYEKQENEESKFVYVLDKLHPVFQIYLDGGRDWRKHEITLEMLIEKKATKAALSPELLPYWEELLRSLKQEENTLFPKNEDFLFPVDNKAA